ncbi:hypothetical protein MKX50_03150 [Paenibacillus sp. FSL W8-0186]|uniref:hypothetical protein n=1 Tax=Paenibacillus sp. FSL W8-0186 TaxID=2921709 RepID=UPI0030D22ED5
MLLDISKEKFELIYLGESHLRFDYSAMTSNRLELDIWGITLPISVYGLEAYGLTESTRPFNDDVYVSGFTKIIFNDVIGCNIEIELFSYDYNPNNLCWPDKTLMKLNKTWGEENLKDSNNIYELEGTLTSPYGRCELSVATCSSVSIELNNADFVPVREYILNTKKYGFNQDFIRT